MKTSSENLRIPINPYWVGGSFLDYCVRQQWMTKERQGRTTRYYATSAGITALKERFGIEIKMPQAKQS